MDSILPPPANAAPDALMAIEQEDFGEHFNRRNRGGDDGVARDQPTDNKRIDTAEDAPADRLGQRAAMGFFGKNGAFGLRFSHDALPL